MDKQIITSYKNNGFKISHLHVSLFFKSNNLSQPRVLMRCWKLVRQHSIKFRTWVIIFGSCSPNFQMITVV